VKSTTIHCVTVHFELLLPLNCAMLTTNQNTAMGGRVQTVGESNKLSMTG